MGLDDAAFDDPAVATPILSTLGRTYFALGDHEQGRAHLEAALEKYGVSYERHLYPGTRHGFHNNSTPRYDEAAAKLAWQRTVAFFKEHLA